MHTHIKIYEQFSSEEMVDATKEREVSKKYETESTEFIPTDINSEGDYIVSFTNSEGKDCTVTVSGANDPKYSGDSMISTLELLPDSSSDGKEYNIVGLYDEASETEGEYELTRIMIEEA